MEKTITLSLKEIAEWVVTSYQWNSHDAHMERCSAYALLIGDEAYAEVAEMAKQMVAERNIKPQVR